MAKFLRRVATALVGFAAMSPASAHASATANVCQLTAHITLSPGLSMTPSSGEFGTYVTAANGTRQQVPGTLACQGFSKGVQITGPGTITINGTYGTGALSFLQGGDTCTERSGSAHVRARIPTTAGIQKLRGTAQIATVAATGFGSGELSGEVRTLTPFQFKADEGQDCVTVPVTGLSVTGAPVALA
jgi:hypothetical protein